MNASVMLTVSVMRKLLNCLAFTGAHAMEGCQISRAPCHQPPPHSCLAGVLWSLAPGLAVFLVFYAVGGTWITAAGFGRRLMRLTYSVLQREADLRFALVRNAGVKP